MTSADTQSTNRKTVKIETKSIPSIRRVVIAPSTPENVALIETPTKNSISAREYFLNR